MISIDRNNITGLCRSRGGRKATQYASVVSGHICNIYDFLRSLRSEKKKCEHFNASNLSQANATDILMSDQQNVIGKRTSNECNEMEAIDLALDCDGGAKSIA